MGSYLFSFLAAFIYAVLANRRNIEVAVKLHHQRSLRERVDIEEGLVREVVLNLVLFTPLSVALLLLAVVPVFLWAVPPLAVFERAQPNGFYAVVGLIAYGFPFATVRSAVVKWVVSMVRQWAVSTQKALDKQRVHERK